MNMKRLLTLVAFFATLQASAQQVNPVPDYVFANRMSAGRNTVTDTAAYFSIGPRYGATRGMMPPMVVDTASFSANKRNGLLIFSVQKNKFLYWDSVGVKWAEMAGTAGTALTSADTAALLSTRAWRQKGIDSLAAIRIGGSGTTNYIPKFTAATNIGNSIIFNDSTNVGIGTANPVSFGGTARALQIHSANNVTELRLTNLATGATSSVGAIFYQTSENTLIGNLSNGFFNFVTNSTERMRIHANGRFGFNTTSDAGYQVDINGTLRTVNGADIATSSGELRVRMADAGDYALQSGGPAYLTSGANTSLTTSAGLHFMAKADNTYNTGFNFQGVASSDMFFGRIASSDDLVVSTSNTGSPSTVVRFKQNGETLFGTNTDAGNYRVQINGDFYNTGSLTTGAPSGGSIKPWKIGEAATVSPTSPNRTLRVEVDGVVYYIHAKTTND